MDLYTFGLADQFVKFAVQAAGGPAGGGAFVPKVGSLVAAALETAGAGIQSDMLDMINGEDGQMLAGLLFLIAVATAVITLAIGGNYRWGRYLLVGPPLFFFLTQVRITSDGTEWQLGDQAFPQNIAQELLAGVNDFDQGERGGKDVSLFFQFWNVFMSDVTQQLITLLNLDQEGFGLSFLNKIETYMSFWDFNFIRGNNVRMLIHTTMVPNCAKFFSVRRMLSDPHTPLPVVEYYRSTGVEERAGNTVALVFQMGGNRDMSTYFGWLNSIGINDSHPFTCRELWNKVVSYLRAEILAEMQSALRATLQPGQNSQDVENIFYRKILTETSRASGMTRLITSITIGPNNQILDQNNQEITPELLADGLQRAVEWILARSLWHEISDRNRFSEYLAFEGTPPIYSTGVGSSNLQSDQVATTSNAIAQFNATEKYQFKGDFVNAALSMPHIQGVMLMMLSAAFPFFALMVVIPGRAGAIFTWMGLWAWLKLWDFGFAVVTMIDNILYAMFPRGPAINPGDARDPGVWVRMMEVDPNYSSATYYNLIATCIFAVPLATGVFVKGGASEIPNLIRGSWVDYSSGLARSAATFYRSIQAQSYGRRMQNQAEAHVRQALARASLNPQVAAWQQQINTLSLAIGASDILGGIFGAERAKLSAQREMLHNQRNTHLRAVAGQAEFDYSISPAGMWASESAVRSRYYSHPFQAGHPGRAMLNAEYADRFFDQHQLSTSAGNSMFGLLLQAGQNLFRPGR